MLKKIGICLSLALCLTTLTGCGSGRAVNESRFSRLEFELNRISSRIDRLDSKLDLLSWSVSPPVMGRTVSDTDAIREQMENLVVDLKAQLSHLKEELAEKSN